MPNYLVERVRPAPLKAQEAHDPGRSKTVAHSSMGLSFLTLVTGVCPLAGARLDHGPRGAPGHLLRAGRGQLGGQAELGSAGQGAARGVQERDLDRWRAMPNQPRGQQVGPPPPQVSALQAPSSLHII